MPSVDVVSKVDLQALDNAINNVKREISTRFDFKNVKSEIAFDRKAKYIHIVTGDDWKVKAVTEMLIGQCARLKWIPSVWTSRRSNPPPMAQQRWISLSRRVSPKRPARRSSNSSRVLRLRSSQLFKTTRSGSLVRRSMTSKKSCGCLRSRITTFLCSLQT